MTDDELNRVIASLPAGACVVGVDEVGRGPLAGDVVAAAVVLDPGRPVAGLADSKKLSEKRREQLAAQLQAQAQAVAVGRASVQEIDTLNILQASLLAMWRAVDGLAIRADLVLVDGKHLPRWSHASVAVIGGDARVPAIAAASIVAKVTRDREMQALHRRFPQYGFDAHKGYPTAAHRRALEVHGACPEHRRSFAPVRAVTQAKA